MQRGYSQDFIYFIDLVVMLQTVDIGMNSISDIGTYTEYLQKLVNLYLYLVDN